MKQEDDKPVTKAYLKEVLTRVDESLQEYSNAIAKLQQQPPGHRQSYLNTNRLSQIEGHISQLQQDMLSSTQEEKRDDTDQSSMERQFQQLEARLDQLERLEKKEEYDQTALERDFQQQQRDFDLLERRIRDMEYKLKKL